MKKLMFLLVAAGMVVAVAGIQSCKSASQTSSSKMLKFNLEQGKGYDYDMVWDLDTKMGDQLTTVSLTALYSMNIASIDDNIRSVSTAYKSIRMSMNVMGMQLEMDSDKPLQDTAAGSGKENPLAMMNKVMKGIVGKRFIIKVDEEGKVLEVTGFERIINDMVDSMGLDESIKIQVMASMKDQFSDQTIKDQFAQVFTIFPNKEIKVGDSWEKTYSTGGKMAATYTTTYKVKEIEGDHVTLTTNTKIGSESGQREIEGTQTGNIIVDSKTGLMINAEFDQDFDVNAEGQTVEVKGKGRIKGKAN